MNSELVDKIRPHGKLVKLKVPMGKVLNNLKNYRETRVATMSEKRVTIMVNISNYTPDYFL